MTVTRREGTIGRFWVMHTRFRQTDVIGKSPGRPIDMHITYCLGGGSTLLQVPPCAIPILTIQWNLDLDLLLSSNV
jgi:hypothetical protein